LKIYSFKNLQLDVKCNERIQDVKNKIQDKDGIPPDQQRLIFGGMDLSNEYVLNDCQIREG
jgi:ubiquitin-large subunit ribosomal protein L40e